MSDMGRCVNVCSPDILLIGCGRRMQRVGDEVRGFLRSSGIKLETVDSVCLLYFFYPLKINKEISAFPLTATSQKETLKINCSFVLQRNAVSTFNFLNEEGRLVAAALLPYGVEQ